MENWPYIYIFIFLVTDLTYERLWVENCNGARATIYVLEKRLQKIDRTHISKLVMADVT